MRELLSLLGHTPKSDGRERWFERDDGAERLAQDRVLVRREYPDLKYGLIFRNRVVFLELYFPAFWTSKMQRIYRIHKLLPHRGKTLCASNSPAGARSGNGYMRPDSDGCRANTILCSMTGLIAIR